MTADDRRRVIGKVISVSADRLVVELNRGSDNFTVVGFDDVHYVARLGSYVIVPVQSDYVVAEVIGLRERDPTATRIGSEEDNNLDKVSSAKYLDVSPVGMLGQGENGEFRFGVSTFPSLYTDVLYTKDIELDKIFEVANAEEQTRTDENSPTRLKALEIGKSVIFQNYPVKARIDEFFGGHVAVLGNTGSGKSCTVATILQSIFTKPKEYKATGATFLLLDVNSEYLSALQELNDQKEISIHYVVLDGTKNEGKFHLPHWFLNLSEWELLLQASQKVQIPILRTALGLTTLISTKNPDANRVRRHFVAQCIIECYRGADGDATVAKFQRVRSLLEKYATEELNTELLEKHGSNSKYGNFSDSQGLEKFLNDVKQHVQSDISLPAYANEPFSFHELEECLEFAILYEEAHGNRQVRDYCSQMITRLKVLGDREEYDFLKHNGNCKLSPYEFILGLLGLEKKDNRKLTKREQIIILDMNGIDDEVVELVSSVLARMIFQTLRRTESRNQFPVHLILEEAHRYIAEKPSRFAIDASHTFERIAKEGRKYGMFLLVASQRPSELSKTVLSQCSNFIIHRIQNPDDLYQIRQMTPFVSDSVLKRLPSLPKQHALIFGNSVNLPTTFRVRDVSPKPKSEDAAIRELWFQPPNPEFTLQLEQTTKERNKHS